MTNKRTIAAVSAAIIALCSVPAAASSADAGEENIHTVTVIDYDGNVMEVLRVQDGEKLDLSGIDVSSLDKHLDIYTQIRFDSWSSYPEAITEDTAVFALYKKMTISLDALPDKTEYYSNTGAINLDGLNVTITVNTQLPEKDENGAFRIDTEVLNIESKCTTEPADLDEAFASGNAATVNVYPIDSEKAIASYDISYYPSLGDADMNDTVNASDASSILGFYAASSTGKEIVYADGQKKRCDVDMNGKVDANDATLVMRYYAEASTSKSPDWERLLSG